MSDSERRRFARLTIPEDAIAYRADGSKLGTVTAASGGGMTVRLQEAMVNLQPGDQLEITVAEPAGESRNSLWVTVVYIHEGALGVEFV